MSYKAIMTTLVVKPHPNADRLELVIIESGETVVAGKGTYTDGMKAIYCPEGGELSHEYCHNNNEYRENHGINKDPAKFGYFDEKRRVKIIKLRGEVSNGYLIPLNAFDFLGTTDLESIPSGTELDTVAGHQFCQKYFTKATRERIASANASKEPKKKFLVGGFEKHFDTSQLFRHYKNLPENAVYYISEKIHATSGRTGYLEVVYNQPPVTFKEKAFHWFMDLIGHRQTTDVRQYMLISGSRNVDFDPFKVVIGESYRHRAQQLFEGKLREGETIYYELCYTGQNGGAVQKSSVPRNEEFGKELARTYGPHIEYTYGVPASGVRVFVYRITQQTGSHVLELSWAQILRRIRDFHEPDIQPVPSSEPFCNKQEIEQRIKEYIGDGKSKLDNHLMEGICLRIESPVVPQNLSIMKKKTDAFCYLEGISRNDDSYVDAEEVS
jgi:hypothetical protein